MKEKKKKLRLGFFSKMTGLPGKTVLRKLQRLHLLSSHLKILILILFLTNYFNCFQDKGHLGGSHHICAGGRGSFRGRIILISGRNQSNLLLEQFSLGLVLFYQGLFYRS